MIRVLPLALNFTVFFLCWFYDIHWLTFFTTLTIPSSFIASVTSFLFFFSTLPLLLHRDTRHVPFCVFSFVSLRSFFVTDECYIIFVTSRPWFSYGSYQMFFLVLPTVPSKCVFPCSSYSYYHSCLSMFFLQLLSRVFPCSSYSYYHSCLCFHVIHQLSTVAVRVGWLGQSTTLEKIWDGSASSNPSNAALRQEGHAVLESQHRNRND